MGGEREPRGRENADGSIDVWVRGRRLTFSGGGRKPTVSDEAPPPDAGELPRGVLIDVGNAVTMVSHDGWYARVGADEVGINRSKAHRASGRLYGP